MKRIALLLAGTAALLSACGFHPVGSRVLPEPLKRVRIDMVAPYRVSEPPVETALRTRLIQRGAKILEKSDEAVTVIRLSELRESREVLSVGADGKALEYELILRVNYDVRTGTQVWVPPTPMEVRRDYSFNAQQILPKEQEAERLRKYLEDEMAELLLLRIEAAASRPAPAAGAPVPATEAAPVSPAASETAGG
jgi:LPS-assembly lipoprotein